MKKVKSFIKNNIKLVLGIIIGLVIAGGGFAVVNAITGSNVTYTDTYSIGATTVQGAIDKLYEKASSAGSCPEGYKCLKTKSLCKRASTLHTETCKNKCSNYGYNSGDKIIYGNETIVQGYLKAGDAFDCDVNGDGNYDSTTERFYYVSSKSNGVSIDSDIAVLLYYKNYSAGAWYSTETVKFGPVNAIKYLPKSDTWSNVSLTSTIRDITTQYVGIEKKDFSYEGYVSRLLTYQEVEYCKRNIAECIFLFENTSFSTSGGTIYYWLESAYGGSGSDSGKAFYVSGSSRTIDYRTVTDDYSIGARPVIEVPKADIDY